MSTTPTSRRQFVHVHCEGALATLEIQRPEALNALNAQVLEEVHSAACELAGRADIGVVVLRGSGEKSFVAGADIKEMSQMNPVEAQAFSEAGSRAFSAVEALPQVVIARVQGFALGGGLELALAADFIVASEKAKFGFPEVTLGLIPGFGGTQRLPRRIGVARALEWIASGRRYSAGEALAVGLVNSVYPAEDMDKALSELVAAIGRVGPSAVRRAKRVVRLGSEMPCDAGCALESGAFGLCFGMAESQEGMAAFLEKRSASFSR